MSKEIIFVGAGSIGLWVAVQIKLQCPDIQIVLKERHPEYPRIPTLKLEPQSFADCFNDDTGVISGIVAQLEVNPYIRIDILEEQLRHLACSLGINIDDNNVEQLERDVLDEYPDAAMVIGADGVQSMVGAQLFGEDNAQKSPFAYAVQIKYVIQQHSPLAIPSHETRSLLEPSNFPSVTYVGRVADGKTPVTIHHLVDKDTFDEIQHLGSTQPLHLFSEEINQLPTSLLNRIKTHIGSRIVNEEDILVDTVNVSATELPQQRCKKTITFHGGRFYGLIGDAALALSFFRGINSGLQLATVFSKAIVSDWEKIINRDETALADYEEHYDDFATAALQHEPRNNGDMNCLNDAIQAVVRAPLQLLYFTKDDMKTFHRRFEVIHKLNQAYLEASPEHVATSVYALEHWLTLQLIPGLPLLRVRLLNVMQCQGDPELVDALQPLLYINLNTLDRYEKAYLSLAISKTCDLLENPTVDKYDKYQQFNLDLKSLNTDFYQRLSHIAEVVLGAVAIILGFVCLPVGGLLIAAGGLLAAHGIFQLQTNVQDDSEVSQAVDGILKRINNPSRD